jgi:hypothetical protein
MEVSSQSMMNTTIGENVKLYFKMETEENGSLTSEHIFQNDYEKEEILYAVEITTFSGIFDNYLNVTDTSLLNRASHMDPAFP